MATLLDHDIGSDDRDLDAQEPDTGSEKLRERREMTRLLLKHRLTTHAEDESTAMSKKDVQVFMDAMSEKSLRDAASEREKNEWLDEWETKYVPAFLRQTAQAGQKALTIINEAEKNKWILGSSAAKWRKRLKEGSWQEKRKFIQEKLPEFQKNWKSLADDYKKMRALEKKLGLGKEDFKAHKELAAVHSDDFKGGKLKFQARRDLVDKAIAYLTSMDKGPAKGPQSEQHKALYAEAKKQLETAAQKGVLAKDKVGHWLRRIFESGAPAEKIQKFLNGEGSSPLSELVNNWTDVRNRFTEIEKRRQMEGTPASFHFVHMDVFLKWDYNKRLAYVEEAGRRFEDMQNERTDFLKIRNALDTKDWDGAEELIAEAKGKDLPEKERSKLTSMERFLKEHRTDMNVKEKKETPTDEEVVEEARQLIGKIPNSERSTFEACLGEDPNTFWVLSTLWYNRVWCAEHGYKERIEGYAARTNARELTEMRINFGHGRGHEVNDVTGKNNEQPAIRDQRGFRAAQTLITDEESKEKIRRTCKENTANRDFWYWTSIVPKGVKYEDHEYIVKNILPRLKKLSREMDRRGISYTRVGPVRSKSKEAAAYRSAKNPSMN